jgi:uncharacterized protein YjhX (UPF0386 family)
MRVKGNLIVPDKTNDAIRKLVIDNGYDGLSVNGSPYVIYNKGLFKLRSQLKAEWNKAKK